MKEPQLLTADVTGALDSKALSSDERGSATVVMVAVIASVFILTISGLVLATAVLASHRARTAADLAALSAATVLMRGEAVGAACESAAQVAAMNDGRLEQCIASGTGVFLTVAVTAGVKGVGVATARSRAGPAPGPGSGPLGAGPDG